MGTGKIVLNFVVKNNKGNLVQSCLRYTKPTKVPINVRGLKYRPPEQNFPTILNIKTGKQEQILMDEIDSIPKDGRYFDLSAYNSLGEEIGLVRLKDAPNNNLWRMLGEEGKDSLYIDFWATSPNYKGVGSKMLEEIVRLSNRSGYGGRVSLSACTGSIPSSFMAVCGGKKIQDMSCAIKYHKMGFRSTSPELETKIQNTILNGGIGLNFEKSGLGCGYRDLLTGPMELTPETIKRYLHYNSIT